MGVTEGGEGGGMEYEGEELAGRVGKGGGVDMFTTIAGGGWG